MDLTQIHWLYKVAIISLIWVGCMNWSFTGKIIVNMLEPWSYKIVKRATVTMGTITLIGYGFIIAAVIRLVYMMFWGTANA
jgi:hypothetical protein